MRIETHERYSENPVPFTQWILGHVDARPGQRLIDVGSGSGQYHDRLAGIRVIAVDMSAGMLEKVKVPAVQADAQALPFLARSFERVMANHVLYHFADIPRALREMRRVAAPGARVVMAANSRRSMGSLFALTDEMLDGAMRDTWTLRERDGSERTYQSLVRMYTPYELKRELASAGFRVLKALGGWDASELRAASIRLMLLAEAV